MPVIQKLPIDFDGKKFNTRTIDSSNVQWVAWPKEGQPLMLVKYKGGSIYAYLGVSRQRAVAAAYHPSTGKYINRRIKPHFKAVQIEGHILRI